MGGRSPKTSVKKETEAGVPVTGWSLRGGKSGQGWMSRRGLLLFRRPDVHNKKERFLMKSNGLFIYFF